MQQSCTGGQSNCLFPVNKGEEEEENEKEKVEEKDKQQKEDKIRTTMQSSIPIQQSCTHG